MNIQIFSKILVIAGVILLPGCGTLYLDAPPGSDVKLLSKKAATTIRVQKTVWFKWWGKEPVNPEDVHAATIIKQQRLTEARIRMTNTLVDGIVTVITGIVGFPRRTLIVEGNRKPGKGSAASSSLRKGKVRLSRLHESRLVGSDKSQFGGDAK